PGPGRGGPVRGHTGGADVPGPCARPGRRPEPPGDGRHRFPTAASAGPGRRRTGERPLERSDAPVAEGAAGEAAQAADTAGPVRRRPPARPPQARRAPAPATLPSLAAAPPTRGTGRRRGCGARRERTRPAAAASPGSCAAAFARARSARPGRWWRRVGAGGAAPPEPGRRRGRPGTLRAPLTSKAKELSFLVNGNARMSRRAPCTISIGPADESPTTCTVQRTARS